jgi:hypothetical protein
MPYNQTDRQVFQLDTSRLRLRALGKPDVEHNCARTLRRVIERLGFAIEEADIWEEPLCGGVARLADCYVLRRIRE